MPSPPHMSGHSNTSRGRRPSNRTLQQRRERQGIQSVAASRYYACRPRASRGQWRRERPANQLRLRPIATMALLESRVVTVTLMAVW